MDLALRTLVLGVTKADSLAALAQTVATGLATRRSVVLARVWLVNVGEQTLRLLGSAGHPSGGGSYGRLDGAFSRLPIGAGKIGLVATTRLPLIVNGVRGDEDWLVNPGWSARQGVRAVLAYPLINAAEVLGVLAVFDRERPSAALLLDLPFLADVAAARATDLRLREDRPPSPLATSVPAGDLRPSVEPPSLPGGTEVVTRAEMRAIEKQNIEAALARTGGKVFGADGAAALLGMKPTTLASRIKALRLR